MPAPILNPLLLLQDIDRRCRRFLQQDTHQKSGRASPVLLGIHMDKYALGIDSTAIEEVMPLGGTRISALPSAKPWHMGLASVRGQLINVIDLKRYLLGKTTEKQRGTRMIVIRTGDFRSGILVDNVAGLMNEHQATGQLPEELPEKMKLLCKSVTQHQEQTYLEIDVARLFEDPDFSQAVNS